MNNQQIRENIENYFEQQFNNLPTEDLLASFVETEEDFARARDMVIRGKLVILWGDIK